jgi:multicomponent Na+:H+ antiporter subunit E
VIRAVRQQPIAWVWLTAAWVVMWGTLSFANVLGGMVVGAVLLTVLRMPPISVGVRLHPLPALVLLARFVVDVVVASFHVAWLAVRPGPVPRASVITTELHTRNELFATLVAEIMSLVPGSLVIDLDPGSGRLSMHVLDVATPEQADAFRARVLAQERRVLAALSAPGDPVVHPGGTP